MLILLVRDQASSCSYIIHTIAFSAQLIVNRNRIQMRLLGGSVASRSCSRVYVCIIVHNVWGDPLQHIITGLLDTYAKRLHLTNFSRREFPLIRRRMIMWERTDGKSDVGKWYDNTTKAGRYGRRLWWWWWIARTILIACFRDIEPSNDSESTRLVARIIQFEYVYGPAARTRTRGAHVRVPQFGVIPGVCIRRSELLLAFSLP